MKLLAFVSLLLITGCAARPKPSVQLLASPLVEPSVRYAEIIRTYHVGRYVDSSDVMHEQHPIHRVEAQARWNLKPGSALEAILLNPPPDSAYAPTPTNDIILAELSRQKDATQRVMREALQLARSYDDLQKVIKEMTAVAKNHALVNARVANAERQMVEVQRELERLGAPPVSPTNDVRSFNSPDPNQP